MSAENNQSLADAGRDGLRDLLSGRREPFAPVTSARPHWAEWLIYGAIAAALVSVLLPVLLAMYDIGPAAAAPASVLAVAQCVSIPLVLVSPRWAAIVHVVSVAGLAVLTLPAIVWAGANDGMPWPLTIPGMIALTAIVVGLCLRGRLFLAIATWAASGLALLVAVILAASFGAAPGTTTADIIVSVSVSAGAIIAAAVVAQLVRARREVKTVRVEAEEIDEKRRWALERARIAREMHDVVAHSMSLVHMRATSARYRLDNLSDEAADEFDGIAVQARTALGEMRGLLSVLRDETDRLDAPQPGFADLPMLFSAARDAGIAITANIPAPPPEASGAAQLAFYRVAQESLSNVTRHAGGATTHVELDLVGGDLVLSIRNDPPAPDAPPPSDRGGHGIRGMMERMASVDGTLTHGQAPDGGYSVVASAPHDPERAS